MGATGAWTLLWSLLAVVLAVLAVAGGVLVARTLGGRRREGPPEIPATPSRLQEARDALRLRYAHGEISREDYLQGKVELED